MRNGKLKAAYNELEKIPFGSSDFDRGYKLALTGMVNATSDGTRSSPSPLVVRLARENGKTREILASRSLEEFEHYTHRHPLPDDELGFNQAWIDVLEKFI